MALSHPFGRAVTGARAVVFWERLWPRLVPPLNAGSLFVTTALSGLWHRVPAHARLAGVASFAAVAALSALGPRTGNLLVTRDEGIARLDDRFAARTGETLRPARTIGDGAAESNAFARALWERHAARLWQRWGPGLKPGLPHPGMDRRDPYRLRYAVAAGLAASVLFAGEQGLPRLREAFDFSSPLQKANNADAANLRVKAWVTPPEGIDGEQLYLTEATPAAQALAAHKGSTVTMIVYGPPAEVAVDGAAVKPEKILQGETAQTTGRQYSVRLRTPVSTIAIQGGPHWRFAVAPDNPPRVALGAVGPDGHDVGMLDIACRADDDFGLRDAAVAITPTLNGGPGARALSSASIAPVSLPPADPCGAGNDARGFGPSQPLPDETASPLAGTPVSLALVAHDALGQEGRDARTVVLPARAFRNPATKDLAQLRRRLALDARQAGPVAAGIGQVLAARRGLIVNLETFSDIQAVAARIAAARDDRTLDDAVGALWDAMLRLEEDSATKAEKELRDAQKDLRQAVDQAAKPDDLRQKMDRAEKALADALAEKAAQAKADPWQARELEEMRKMADEMRKMMEAMRNADPQAAQQMLQQMRQMQDMQRQSAAQQQQSRQDMRNAMQQQMQHMKEQLQQMRDMQQMKRDLDDLIKRQQALRDQTAQEQKARDQRTSQTDMNKVRDALKDAAGRMDEKTREKLDDEKKQDFSPSDGMSKEEKEQLQAAIKQNQKNQQSLKQMDDDAQKIQREMGDLQQQGKPAGAEQAQSKIDQLKQMQQALDQLEQQGDQPQDQQDQQQAGQQQSGQQQSGEQQSGQQPSGQQGGKLSPGQQSAGQQQGGPQGQQPAGPPSPRDMIQQLQKLMQNGDTERSQKLGQQQQSVQQALEQQMQKMAGKGLGTEQMQRAETSSDQASQQLGQNQPGGALPAQDATLQALRDAARQMAQQMQRGPGQPGQGQQPGTIPGDPRNGGMGQAPAQGGRRGDDADLRDPLGRNLGENVSGIDPSKAENQSRAVRDQIRQRLDPSRPKAEREYLERLLGGKLAAPPAAPAQKGPSP